MEIEKRQGKSATCTQPLLLNNDDDTDDPEYTADVQAFLAEFYHGGSGGNVERASSDRRLLFKHHPTTIATHYALLVPIAVSFDQFW